MRAPSIIAISLLCAGLLPRAAHGEDYWAACTACGSADQRFALGVPADIQGIHTVHVYDESRERLRSYRVFVDFDHEVRAWSRFVVGQPATVAALDTLAAVRHASAFMVDVGELTGPIGTDVPSVQDYLLARGALDRQIASHWLIATDRQGLMQRLLNATTLLHTTAGRILAPRSVEATYRVVFADSSSIRLSARFLADRPAEPVMIPVGGSARLPDGTRLPETEHDIDGLYVATDNPDTINALQHWLSTVGARGLREHAGLPAGFGYGYLLTCDAKDCVLLATAAR